jgi:hypothetical protein
LLLEFGEFGEFSEFSEFSEFDEFNEFVATQGDDIFGLMTNIIHSDMTLDFSVLSETLKCSIWVSAELELTR